MFKKSLLLLGLILIISMVLLSGCADSIPEVADRPFTFISWGGSYQEAQEKFWLEPWAEENSVEYFSSSPTDLGRMKAMIETGNIEWDVVDADMPFAVPLYTLGGLETLDYSIIDTSRIPPEFVHDFAVYCISYSTVLAWNTDRFAPGEEPKTWADFWDVEKFPGKRAIYNSPFGNMEIALLADGVPLDEIYPLTEEKINRALSKLEEMKPHAIWWESGAQPAQLLADGEVSMATGWNGRFFTLLEEGAPLDYSFNQGILQFDVLMVMKGSPYKDLAMEFINFALSPEAQADVAMQTALGPINPGAFDFIEDEMAHRLNTNPEVINLQVVCDDIWWAENIEEMYEIWNEWFLK